MYNLKNGKNPPWTSITFSKVAGLSLKVIFLHGCFSRFLNCTISTKPRNKSHMLLFWYIARFFRSESHCWRIVPENKTKLLTWLLNNRANDCWTIVPTKVEQFCQWLLMNCTSDYWTIVPATVEQLCRQLLENGDSDC